MTLRTTVSTLLLALTVSAQQSAWGQCGGIGWSGATSCVSGYYCSVLNSYYSQCIPGTATTTLSTLTTSSSRTTTTAATTTTGPTSSSFTTTTAVTTTAPGSGSTGTPTLSSGWLWIRADESPNFHSYLQTKPTDTPGVAIMDSPNTAGQFNIVNGQLVYNTGSGELYMNVENPTDKTQRALQTWFNETQNTYGTFAFSGDAVEWTDPDVDRPNLSAWYVCGDQELYINTGAYLYQTPSGCYDQTINYYNGATPTV